MPAASADSQGPKQSEPKQRHTTLLVRSRHVLIPCVVFINFDVNFRCGERQPIALAVAIYFTNTLHTHHKKHYLVHRELN